MKNKKMYDFIQFKNQQPKTLPLPEVKGFGQRLYGGYILPDANDSTIPQARKATFAPGSGCFVSETGALKTIRLSGVKRDTDFSTFPASIQILLVDEWDKTALVLAPENTPAVVWESADECRATLHEPDAELMERFSDLIYVIGSGMWELTRGEIYFTPNDEL